MAKMVLHTKWVVNHAGKKSRGIWIYDTYSIVKINKNVLHASFPINHPAVTNNAFHFTLHSFYPIYTCSLV